MNSPLRNFAALLLLALTSGCVEEDVPKNDYFPLRDGNHWEYRLLDRPLLQRMAAHQIIETAPLKKENPNLHKADILDNIPDDVDTSIEIVEPAAEVADDATTGARQR